ncbi:MAG: hypothetical protein BGO68_02510 [Candidatus Amoebophilus sp. 36-38]|nr:MAG: hypothetical protein BGO68_02510 [Candidatus Amoebophilus sp. 36-38]
MKEGNTWSENAIVPANRLRLLTIGHIDFQGNQQIGQMIVLDVCEEAVLTIFKELYKRKFPIHQIKPMHHYQGDDHAALAANNTSCYIDRNIIGSTKKSVHAYGLAIDINPVQNPFVTMDEKTGIATYDPTASIAYANRMLARLGKATRAGMAEEVINIFAENGFYWWGGYWDTPIDYQHFQVSSMFAQLYLAMNPQEAKQTFKEVSRYYNIHQQPIEEKLLEELKQTGEEGSLVDYYKKDKKWFATCFNKLTRPKK